MGRWTDREASGDGLQVDVRQLQRALRDRVDGEIRFDAGSRGAYSTDASNYRQVPIGVVVPRSVEAGAEAIAVCHELRAPVISRGGGTSLAGQTCNAAVILDWSKYCHRLLSVDESSRARPAVRPVRLCRSGCGRTGGRSRAAAAAGGPRRRPGPRP
ncbi:MAG TPA: FAD-binding protein [Kineosporiaceae bacterium]|nr:FAD-binding protein [Kineosporiaceae bacterium]